MSKTMMLIASALSLAAPCTLTAASPGNAPLTAVARTNNNNRTLTTPQIDARAVQAMHFAIQGRTATWSFRFSCTGARCSFHNTHHSRDPQELGYVSIATIFDQQTNRDNAHALRVIRVAK
jgi:hypothetical protein